MLRYSTRKDLKESRQHKEKSVSQRFYRMKVSNAIKIVGEEGVARLLQEEVSVSKKLRPGSKCLVKRHDNLLWKKKRR